MRTAVTSPRSSSPPSPVPEPHRAPPSPITHSCERRSRCLASRPTWVALPRRRVCGAPSTSSPGSPDHLSVLPVPLPLPFVALPFPFPLLPLSLTGLSDLSLLSLPWPWSDGCAGGSAAGGAGVVSVNCVACGLRSGLLPCPLSAAAAAAGAALAAGGSVGAGTFGAAADDDSGADEGWAGGDAAVAASGCDAGRATGFGRLRVEVTWSSGRVDVAAGEAIVAVLRSV